MADKDATAACPAAAASSPPLPPLFDRVGGMTALINAVDVFYARVLADPTLAPFFEGVEMSRQRTKQVRVVIFPFPFRFLRERRRRRVFSCFSPLDLFFFFFFFFFFKKKKKLLQVQFLCYAFGGPGQYLGKSIAEAHERLIRERGVHRGHFWTVAQHLRESLEQLQVPDDLIEECISNIAPAASVFPEPGGPPVPGPEPVPAEGTPAAVRKILFCFVFFFWGGERGEVGEERKRKKSHPLPLLLTKNSKQELARQRAKESAANAAACPAAAAAAAGAGGKGEGQQDLAGD